MQEEVEQKTIALVINATKLTGRGLKKAIVKLLEHQKNKKNHPNIPQGKQSVKQLAKQGQGMTSIDITDQNIKDFERVARKYGVDFAVMKDKHQVPPKYVVYFKGKDADAITNAFKEYTADMVKKAARPSVLAELKKLAELVKNTIVQKVKHNCTLIRLDYQQEQGFMTSLPIGKAFVPIQRSLTTSSTAIFVPFTTQELFQSGGEALYYGLNALSSNLIMVDRKLLKNPNGLILGTPGSGKSFAAKREITNVFLITTDDIIVCDPEGEYFSLVQRLKGQVIKISPTSSQYINPMDININYSEDDSPLALKSDFILSLCELIVGGKEGLTPVEKSIIDRCVTLVYAEYLADCKTGAVPDPAKMPILGDLYDALGRQEEKEAKHIRSALEIYVTGSLSVNNQTQLKHLFRLTNIIEMTTDCLNKEGLQANSIACRPSLYLFPCIINNERAFVCCTAGFCYILQFLL